jgi:hypothetical protein
MGYQQIQKMAGGFAVQTARNEVENMIVYRTEEENSTQKYLRFWGTDYQYLKSNSEKRWLPVPENSDVQRFLRKLNWKL